ncbi:MAG: Sel1 domain-containing protein repeat-containing protein [Gallionellaceae bacterium]|nr:MAG: Sel1 domain-containing protein repeat-containing protein [Gallionellaceae bacterium]
MMGGAMKPFFGRAFFVAALAVSPGAQADFQDAVDAYNGGNFLYAFDEFRELALNGDAAAQYRLGLMYDKGEGVARDERQAVSWYIRAAGQDDTRAQFAIAEMYSEGRGVQRDDKQAARWYLEAAGHGFPKAQLTVGLMYAKGAGLPQDLVQAYKWLSLAGDIAAGSRQWVEDKMAPEQIRKARLLVQEWLAQHR